MYRYRSIMAWYVSYIYISIWMTLLLRILFVLPWWDMVQQKLGAKPLLDVLRPQCSRRRRVWRWPWTKPWCAFWTFCVWPLGTMMPLSVIDICRWRGFNQWRCGFCQQNCRGIVNCSLCCEVYMAQKNGFPLEMVRFERPPFKSLGCKPTDYAVDMAPIHRIPRGPVSRGSSTRAIFQPWSWPRVRAEGLWGHLLSMNKATFQQPISGYCS